MTSTINYSEDVWVIIDSYFKNVTNYLTKNQINSYNTFLDINIPKTIRQFNPIELPYGCRDCDNPLDPNYLFELKITVGGSIDNSEVLNDGKGIYIGKPIIQELKQINETEIELHKKTLYPNEARLKNLTYKTDILVDIIIEIYVNDNITERIEPIKFEKIPLGSIPIMLHSKICSLHNITKSNLKILGECEYDQGGYFILDGKEKVIVSQERQVENKIYINHKNNDMRYKLISEIRSAPENKFQPARVTKLVLLKEKVASNKKQILIKDNCIRVIIPQINDEVPLFFLYRALGICSDKDILNTIVNIDNNSYSKEILEFLRPTIMEGSIINSSYDAFKYLSDENKISKKFLLNSSNIERKHFTIDILRNHLFPHVGTNMFDKIHFLSYMVRETIDVFLKLKPDTDRDSYMYKRVDNSGFLISAIFRDLYFRIKNKLIETLNIAYNKKNNSYEQQMKKSGTKSFIPYWENYKETAEKKRKYNFFKFIGIDDTNCIININRILDRSLIDEGINYAFKNCWGLKNAPCKEGVVQDISRISYLGFISHLRRITTPLSSSAKVRAPHSLHGSSWGYMCPVETPDGANIGLRKHLSILSDISFGTNSKLLEKCLFSLGVQDIKIINNNNLMVSVFLNERIVGTTDEPFQLFKRLKLLK